MSAAVNDRPHEIVPLPHLPLTGELHPLRREFARWLATGNVITITIAVVVCTTIYFWPRPEPLVNVPGVEGLVKGFHPQPPPIVTPGGSPGQYDVVTDVKHAIFEPTPNEVVTAPDVDPSANGDGDGPVMPGAVTGPIVDTGPLVIDPPAPRAAEVFTPFDTEPVLISIDPPAYAQILRDAGIEGTVTVRVFIGLDGHVKDARVVDGSSALRDAALASARTAYFKPALQGTHPVEVWVAIPITFELRQRY